MNLHRLAIPCALLALAGCRDLLAGSGVTCPSGETACGRSCIATATDPENCGGCGIRCEAREVCSGGLCGPGTEICAGRACGTGEECRSGECLAAVYVACFNSDEVREADAALAPAGVPLATDHGPVRLAWLGGTLFIANGLAGTVSRIQFDPPAVRSIHGQDAFLIPSSGGWADLEYLAAQDGLLYVSDTSVGTLVVLRPDGTVVDEIPLAKEDVDAPAPQAVHFPPQSSPATKAYAALNGTDQVAVLDLTGEASCATGACGRVMGWIDLSPLASTGGRAFPARLAQAGSRLFVSLWNLDPAHWTPAGSGRLAVIDTSTDTLDAGVNEEVPGLLDLGPECLNPAEMLVEGDTLYVSCGAFDYSTDPPSIAGSGVVAIDLSGETPLVRATFKQDSQVAPGKLAFCNGVGYVADRNSGRVFRFDPGTGLLTGGAEICPTMKGYAYAADLVCGF